MPKMTTGGYQEAPQNKQQAARAKQTPGPEGTERQQAKENTPQKANRKQTHNPNDTRNAKNDDFREHPILGFTSQFQRFLVF